MPSDGIPPGAVRGDDLASERRIVTVLAADIVDSTPHIAACDPDDAQAFYDTCFEYVRDAVERAQGALVSYAGDGGIAVFGWPNPLEDHADRACAAAWDIQRTHDGLAGPDGLPVRFRVGVHSGLASVRRIDRGSGPVFDTIGATVNIAAKLEQNAPTGAILVSAQAMRLCRSRLTVTAHAPSPTFGAVQIEAFRLESGPDRRHESDFLLRYRSPMIGREGELASLRDRLPREGAPNRAVALLGEAGIGKSPVVAAAAPRGIRVHVFFGDAQLRTTPFAAARELINAALAQREDGLRPALEGSRLGEEALSAAESFLSPHEGSGRETRSKLTETQLARALVDSFCALAVDRPSLIVVEDLHLIDPESRLFLRLLAEARTRHPFLLMVTGRPEADDEAAEVAQEVVRLDPLGEEAMEDLALQLWPEERPPREVIDGLLSRAEGVPFILEELIRSLDGGKASPTALPTTVESVIHARLQRLSPSAKALAQALSLLGEHVDVEFVGAVLGRDPASLRDDLGELEKFAFIHPLSGNFAHMRHQMIAEASTNTISRGRRRELHKTAVEAILERSQGLGGRYQQLAFHAEGAGLDEPALDYLWEAGLEARRTSAAGSLNLIFDRAIELIARIGPAAEGKYVDFVLMAFALMVQRGEFDKMNTHLPRVIELARRWGRPSLVSSSLSQLGMISWFEGRYDTALKATEEGLALAHELNAPALVFSNQIMLANALHDVGRVTEAIAEGRKICDMLTGKLETARLGATGIPKAIALSFQCWFMMDTGEYAEGRACAEQALEIAEREQDPYSEVLARSALGRSLLMLGLNGEAEACMRAALRLSEQNGYDAIKPDLAGRTAAALARMGRSGEGVDLVEDCLAKGLHLRTGQLEVYFLYAGYAEALIRQGRVEQGLDALANALAIAERVGNPCWMADGLRLRAHLLGSAVPGDPRVEADLAESDVLCERYGLRAWRPMEAIVA
jgi:class 3 adenylate cyclase/tetratricopeptide (TPR) repeat protein